MKKVFALILCLALFSALASTYAWAVSDADNGILKVYGKADMDSPFYESGCPEAYGFDVRGYVELNGETELIGSTFSNYGYHTYLNVDGAGGLMSGSIERWYNDEMEAAYARYENGEIGDDQYSDIYDEISETYYSYSENREAYWNNMAYNCAGALTQNIGGLNLAVNNSYVGNGRYVKISYTVSNPTGSAKKFSLATTADVQINGDDSAIIKMLPGGKGAKMISDNDDTMFTVDGSAGGVDSLWIGGWSGQYFVYMFDDSEDDAIYEDGDSAICWSFTERTIKAGETLNYYVLLEVGLNQAAHIRFTDTEVALGEELNGIVSDPNIGTVDIHYTVNGGEEQILSNIFVNGRDAEFSLPLGDVDCSESVTVVAWAVDDAGSVGEKTTYTFNISHSWGPAEITTVPTGTTSGEAEYVCSVCGAHKDEELWFGDTNGDGYVDNLDALLILKYDAGIIDLNPLQLCICDADGDGYVDNLDALLILKYDAGIIPSFPNAFFSIDDYRQLCEDYYR